MLRPLRGLLARLLPTPAPLRQRPRAGDRRKPCCLVPENLELIEDKPHVQVHRCTLCGCRHFRAFMGKRLQPGEVKVG